MSDPSAAAVRAVQERAAGRCEYCLTHQSMQVATFHIEHVIPASAGGSPEPDNLALACPTCNLHKANRISAEDPKSGAVVSFFHPRNHVWSDHFAWSRYEIMGRTPTGRATVAAFDLNHPRRRNVRIAEERFGLFPPLIE